MNSETLLVLLGIALFLWIVLSRGHSSKNVHSWREVRTDSDASSVQYRDQAGRLKTETDGCNGCIVSRAEELQRAGLVVEEVRIGRRNTGEL